MGPLQDIFETWAKFLYEENATLAFLRCRRWLILAVSVAVLIPCFWHRRIEAGDLGSHVYNAWLAQLIEKGQAPGLYISGQWNNILFDVTLLRLEKIAGFAAAQKIAVSICVLTFFWGVFAFVNAVTERPPWFVTPYIAMLAYGYSFSMGFVNYCWSLGLACFALAMVWRAPRRVDWIGAAIFALPAYVAHPIGFLWLVGMLTYAKVREELPGWWKLTLPMAAGAAFYAVYWYALHRPALSADWDRGPFYLYNGADQLAVYGKRYIWLAVAAFCFVVVCVGADLFAGRGERGSWKRFTLPFEWYAVAFCATALLPENLRPSPDAGWIGLLGSRLTTVSAIFGLCFLGLLRPRKWLAGFGACAVVFFAFLYQDTGWLNRLEANAEKLVSGLSPGARVIVTLDAPQGSRIQFVHHAVERACIGHCFSYANYEPSSGEFRVRVREGSPVVTSSTDTAEDMASGEYEMDETDLPLRQIYQCDASDLTKLCMRELKAGDDLNVDIGRRPGHR